jgi:hypothetical protein
MKRNLNLRLDKERFWGLLIRGRFVNIKDFHGSLKNYYDVDYTYLLNILNGKKPMSLKMKMAIEYTFTKRGVTSDEIQGLICIEKEVDK